jgi:hypothetical protein
MAQQQEPVAQQPPRVPAVQHRWRAQQPSQRPGRLICHLDIVAATGAPGTTIDPDPASPTAGKGALPRDTPQLC